MRGKILAVLALGLGLTAGKAAAQQSDLLPPAQLRENLRRLREDLRDRFDARDFGVRIRARSMENARVTRLSALAAARAERESARAFARMDRVRPMVRVRPFHVPVVRDRVRFRHYRDI